MPFEFTDDDWDRPDGHTVIGVGTRSVWSKAAMQWRVHDIESGRHLQRVK